MTQFTNIRQFYKLVAHLFSTLLKVPQRGIWGLNQKKGLPAYTQKIPFPSLYDRKSICNSRVSILMLRQFHSFPYKGDLYIVLINLTSKTNVIF